MDIIPLKSNPRLNVDGLDPMRKTRHEIVYERSQMINQLMRNTETRKQFFTNGLKLPNEIDLPKQNDTPDNEISDDQMNTDPRRYENELSHFQNQAIVDELGEAGPISLNLTNAVQRADSDMLTNASPTAAKKKTLVNVEIISNLKPYNGFLPNFSLPNSQRRAPKRMDNIISAQTVKMEQVKIFQSRSPEFTRSARKEKSMASQFNQVSGRTAKSVTRVNSIDSDRGARADNVVKNSSTGDQGGSQGGCVSVPKSTNRFNEENSNINNVDDPEMTPATVKMQAKTRQSNSFREKKTETFGNLVKDYNEHYTYTINWKSDSLKKRYEKVVGSSADQVVTGTAQSTIYSKLKGKNVLPIEKQQSQKPKRKTNCRCSTKLIRTMSQGINEPQQVADLKMSLKRRKIHPKSKRNAEVKSKTINNMAKFDESLRTKSAPATGHYNNRGGARVKRDFPLQSPNKHYRLAHLRTSNEPAPGYSQPGGPKIYTLPSPKRVQSIYSKTGKSDGRLTIKEKQFSQNDAEQQAQSQRALNKDVSHRTEEMQEVEVLKNVEQNMVYLTDSMSDGTNRMSANKIAGSQNTPNTKMSGHKRESLIIEKKKQQSNPHLTEIKEQPKLTAPMRSKTSDIQKFTVEGNKEIKELNHNSKSVESIANEDGGSNLHEVLKPKGIEIYSTSQANPDGASGPQTKVNSAASAAIIVDQTPVQEIEKTDPARVEGEIVIETQNNRSQVKVQLNETPQSSVERTCQQTVNLVRLDSNDEKHSQILSGATINDVITAVRSSISDNTFSPPVIGSGQFSGNPVFADKLIQVAPLDQTFRQSTIKSEEQPKKPEIASSSDAQDGPKGKQTESIGEREEKSSNSFKTEISLEGLRKEQVKGGNNTDVEKMIVMASDPACFTNHDVDFQMVKHTKDQDSIRDIGYNRDTPEDSHMNEHSKLKSNYDSKSNIISSRAVMNITEEQMGFKSPSSSNSQIGKISKKSIYLKNQKRALSVSSNVENEQKSQQVYTQQQLNKPLQTEHITDQNSVLGPGNMTDVTLLKEDSKHFNQILMANVRENEAVTQTEFQPLEEPLELALANGMVDENGVMFLPDTQDILNYQQLEFAQQQMGMLRGRQNGGLGYISPNESFYDSSLQREYLHSTRYVKPNGVDQLEKLKTQGGIQVVNPQRRNWTTRNSKQKHNSPPNLRGSPSQIKQQILDDWLVQRGGVERGAKKGQRIICKSIDGQKRIINPSKQELDRHPNQFHIIQVQGKYIPFKQSQEEKKQNSEVVAQITEEQQNKYNELMQGRLQQISQSQNSARFHLEEEQESREIMVRDQAVAGTPFDTMIAESPISPQRNHSGLNAGKHYILNIDNQQLSQQNPLNVVRQVIPQSIQNKTVELQKFLQNPQPTHAVSTSRANPIQQFEEAAMTSGRLVQVPSRQEDLDTVYIHSTMKMLPDATNQKSLGAVSQFNTYHAKDEENKSDNTLMITQQQTIVPPKLMTHTTSQPIQEYNPNYQATQQRFLNINQNSRFLSSKDVQKVTDKKGCTTTASPHEDTLLFEGIPAPFKMKKNDISVLDESINSEKEHDGDRILDISRNFEKEIDYTPERNDEQNLQMASAIPTVNTTSDPSINLPPRQQPVRERQRINSNLQLRDYTDSESHSQLERLNPPSANIRISKSRKQVLMQQQQQETTLNSNLTSMTAIEQRGVIIPSVGSKQQEQSVRMNQPRPQTTKNNTPRDRKIIFLMHKRREIQLRNTRNSKWKTQVASQPDVQAILPPSRNVAKENNQTFFQNISDKMSTVFSLDPTSTRFASTIAHETGSRPNPSVGHSYERRDRNRVKSGTIHMHIKKQFNTLSSGGVTVTTEQTYERNTNKMVNLRAGSDAYRLLRRRPNAKQVQKNHDLGHLSNHLTAEFDENDNGNRGPILEIQHMYGPRLKTAEGTSRAYRSKMKEQSSIIRNEAGASLLGNSMEAPLEMHQGKFTGFDRQQTYEQMKLQAYNHNMNVKISSRKNLNAKQMTQRTVAQTKDPRLAMKNESTKKQEPYTLKKAQSGSQFDNSIGSEARKGSMPMMTLGDGISMQTTQRLPEKQPQPQNVNPKQILNQPSAGDINIICNFEKLNHDLKPEVKASNRLMSGGSHTENRRRARRLHQTIQYQKQLDDQQKKLLKYYDLMNESESPQVPAETILNKANQLEERKILVKQQITDLKQAAIIQQRLNRTHNSRCDKTH